MVSLPEDTQKKVAQLPYYNLCFGLIIEALEAYADHEPAQAREEAHAFLQDRLERFVTPWDEATRRAARVHELNAKKAA